ncbi:hypothetical protein [Alloactinosynnema sp. L-07]|uniref:hypothetical protein n=1 Tax=Alloactinosynnema sp. L-07 TaxID=1653480 RepID=UPI00065F0AA6|nr:hypothetical protein [Alloactinosynnema sp. L-07]CRK56926.1 hypothetical protein [Alloactinosynnema sp. L-07]
MAARHGTDDMLLLFANTQIEDGDLYEFVDASAAQIGVPLVEVADGRTPWQVFEDKQIIVLSPSRHLSNPATRAA